MKNKLKWSHFCDSFKPLKAIPLCGGMSLGECVC